MEEKFIQLVGKCPYCDTSWTLKVSKDAFNKFKYEGVHVQDAFPDMSPDERELLVSGICNTCWDKIFTDE